MNANLDEHPDELQLVAWSEHRLLEFEREAVELHLADCRDCRALAAELSDEELVRPAPSEPAAPAAKSATPVWRLLLAAAVLLVAALIFPWGEESAAPLPGIEMALAGTHDATFGTQRSTPLDTGEFFVGLRLESDSAWLRLIAIDDLGEVFEVPLDPEGRKSAIFPGGADHVFGPYPLELAPDRVVTTVIALASREALDWSDLQPIEWSAVIEASGLATIANGLDAVVEVKSLD